MDALPTLGLLARAQLEARRLGFGVLLRDVPPAIEELIVLVGLDGVLPVEPRGEPEEREEGRGVEEEGQL